MEQGLLTQLDPGVCLAVAGLFLSALFSCAALLRSLMPQKERV